MASFDDFDKDPITLSDGHIGYKHYYGSDVSKHSLLGKGTQSYSVWMKKDDILRLLSDVGFCEINVMDESVHPSGEPCMTIFARKLRY
jgi:hypothetical protein